MKDWDFKDPYIVMLYWSQLNPLSPKVIWCTNMSGAIYPSINTCQDSSDENTGSEYFKTCSRWLFCSNTILADMPELSILEKIRIEGIPKKLYIIHVIFDRVISHYYEIQFYLKWNKMILKNVQYHNGVLMFRPQGLISSH